MTPAPSSRALVPAGAGAAAPCRTEAPDRAARATARRAVSAPVTVLADLPQFASLIGRQLSACRHHGVRHAVILIEIELPPRIGNTADARTWAQLGEAAGARLRGRLRDTDLVAQIGDRRFGVILIDAAKADLNAVQARLHKAVCGHYGIENRLLYIVGRLGAVMYPSGGSTGSELLGSAEAALKRSTLESPWVGQENRSQKPSS